MKNQLEKYATKLLQCVNSKEVMDSVGNDHTAVIMKQFGCEYVVLKYVEDDEYRMISPIYINFEDSSYHIDDFIKQNKYNTFQRLVNLGNGKALVQYDDLQAEISVIYNYPKGLSYQLVLDTGTSGGGAGWGKVALGLD
ncbi:MAG: hypothetical protein WC509_03825 [Candidatus Izemoplasmatales bacterium]